MTNQCTFGRERGTEAVCTRCGRTVRTQREVDFTKHKRRCTAVPYVHAAEKKPPRIAKPGDRIRYQFSRVRSYIAEAHEAEKADLSLEYADACLAICETCDGLPGCHRATALRGCSGRRLLADILTRSENQHRRCVKWASWQLSRPD